MKATGFRNIACAMVLAPITAIPIAAQEPAAGAYEQGAFAKLRSFDPPVNSDHWESMGSISADGLWFYFVSNRPPSVGSEWCVDLWVARRSSTSEPFGEPTNGGVLRNVNSPADECTPNISADDRVLTFYSDRHAPSSGNYDLYVATRENPLDDFGPAVNFSEAYPDSLISSGYSEMSPRMSPDLLSLYFASNRPGGKGGFDIYVSTRSSPGGLFGPAQNLGSVNTPADEFSPVPSRDGLTLFFSDLLPPFREGGMGGGDIWMATRATTEDSLWETARVRNLGWPINAQHGDFDFWISHDWPAEGSTIWFTSDRPQSRLGNENCKNSPFAEEIWDSNIYTAAWLPAKPFRRGDADANGKVELTDATFILSYLFAAGPAPSCVKAADVEDSGALDITDSVYLLAHLFLGESAPPEPFKNCGPDPTEDRFTLSCSSFAPCP